MFNLRISCIIFLLVIPCLLVSQTKIPEYKSKTVVVTATRLGTQFTPTRSVTALTKDEISKLPAQSVAQLLNYALGVSMNSRGIPGVQTDPSLRGAGFEQVLILLDGVRMNDPQTGHHNMNLPVSVSNIEKIEVLRGQSSALYGPDAFGGVINIITSQPGSGSSNISIKGGSFGTYEAAGSLNFSGKISNRLSFSKGRSDGHRDGTDFDNLSLNWIAQTSGTNYIFKANAGYNVKDFGARDFYVAGWDHYEETRALSGGISGEYFVNSKLSLNGKVHHKKHDDMFLLSRENPAIYSADHTTNRTLFEVIGKYQHEKNGTFIFGVESALEDIKSNKLGTHDISRHSVFGEYGKEFFNNFLLTAGLRFDNHTEWGSEINPSLSAGYVVNPSLLLKSSVGRAFRAPTFTELYSPAASGNLGSTTLNPESAIAFDAGAEYTISESISGETTLFYRNQENSIDWIKVNPEAIWTAMNLFDIDSKGIEQSLKFSFADNFSITINYEFLDQEKKQTEFTSKYIFIHPRHKFSVAPMFKTDSGLMLSGVVSYTDRPALNEYWIVDAKISYNFNRYRLNIEGLNLTGSDYMELRSIPMPGASVYSGIEVVY